jgi:L-asparaginase II
VALRQTVEDLAGEPSAAVGVDGCGAPVFALSLTGLARAFQAMVTAPPGAPGRRVADAMRAHPEWTSGSLRPERALMATVPGLLVKAGAEGVQAFALADGRAGVFKIEDGSYRAREPLTVAMLRRLGVSTAPGVPDSALDEIGAVPVLGGSRLVGVVRAVLPG